MKNPTRWIAALLSLCLNFLPGSKSLKAAEDKPPLLLEGAEYVRQMQVGGSSVVVFERDVRWLQGKSRLRCQRAKYFEEEGILYLSREVHLIETGRDIMADSVRYDREEKIAVAMGNVLLEISGGDVTVRTDSLNHRFTNNESWAFKRPQLILRKERAHEHARSEVVVSGDLLRMLKDSTVTVIGEVDIAGDSLAGKSDTLTYNMKRDEIVLVGTPWIVYGSYRLEGDRLDLHVPDRNLRKGISRGHARGEQRGDTSGQDDDDEVGGLVSWIEADTITLSFREERIDSLLAVSEARSFYRTEREGEVEDNYVIGDEILLVWEEGKMEVMRVVGRGEGVYRKRKVEEE